VTYIYIFAAKTFEYRYTSIGKITLFYVRVNVFDVCRFKVNEPEELHGLKGSQLSGEQSTQVSSNANLKGLSYEIDFKNFDKNLQN
jgi:hypothetical protein